MTAAQWCPAHRRLAPTSGTPTAGAQAAGAQAAGASGAAVGLPGTDLPDDIEGLTDFVDVWSEALVRTSFVPMGLTEVRRHLHGLAARLVAAATCEPFDPAPAQEVGRALVAAHFTGAEALGRSIDLIGTWLLARSQAGQLAPYAAPRVAPVLGALAGGYAEALRERVSIEQESLGRAARIAWHDAARTFDGGERWFRAAFAGAATGIAIGDLDGRLVEVNHAFEGLLGLASDAVRGRVLSDLVHPDDLAAVETARRDLLGERSNHIRAERRMCRGDGSVLWADLSLSLIRDDDGLPRYLVAMVEDATERHRQNDQLRHQALHDPLTGLPNRALFLDRLQQVLDNGAAAADGAAVPARREHRYGVLFIDLDGFKAVNDSLGHDTGDRLLQAVADRLVGCADPRRDVVARMSGDEFVILRQNSGGSADVAPVAAAVLAAVSAPILIGPHEVEVSASVGVVEGPVGDLGLAEALRAADTALYWAKSDGRNRWRMYDPARNATEVALHTIATAVPTGIRNGQFHLDYQPVVDLVDGSVVAAEALVRWRHPQLGLLPPARFLPMAEEAALTPALGRWILEEACSRAASWPRGADGAMPQLSINLTCRQVRDRMFVSDVRRILQLSGLPPRALQIELTEAVLALDTEIAPALRTLTDAGVEIAVDNFGAGQSNLVRLRRLPVQALKVSGALVRPLAADGPADPLDEQILSSLVGFAHRLGLRVHGCGVENARQAARLVELGFDSGQGWYFGRPGDAARIGALAAAAELTAP